MKKLLIKIALFVIIDIVIIFAYLNIPCKSIENTKKNLYIVNGYNTNASMEIKFDDKVYLQKELNKYASAKINFDNIEFETCELKYTFNDCDIAVHKFQCKEELNSVYIVLTKDKKVILIKTITK